MTNSKDALRRVHVKKGDIVIRQGDFGTNGYIVQKGQLQVYITQDDREVTLAILGPGDVAGELAVVSDACRSESVRALTDCDLIIIDRDGMTRKLAETDPSIRALIKILSERVKRSNFTIAKAAKGELTMAKA